MGEAYDGKREITAYRARKGRFDLVEVPEQQYLAVDGHGDPNVSDDFTAALETLYPVAYTLKQLARRELDRDAVVMPLEGLWWSDDMATFTDHRNKARWSWTLLIQQPDWISTELVERAVDTVRARRSPPRIDALRFERIAEGQCVQTLHVGSFDDEAPVLARMHDEVIPGLGMRMRGLHHEIYLGDQRRVAPERMRTILRQPVEPA